MAIVEANVIEKWSDLPIAEAEIYINGDFITKTNSEGKFALNIPVGSYELTIINGKYEKNTQTLKVLTNMRINIILTPIFQML